ncbi:RNA polymerase III transcription factor IIIC subunit-domain-containing protein [Talaromyces proteolyticus]|uniref:RNA polymerase III transcription factor IIIC subunit-domain-containing protein n=1 Tax=Talaromyces proteolyticus TaxID=1131652 RepID=A0AAD4Q3R5_9EURO|nr:RNA polymerase III transcription factor IIIC subunit-domain-containing protein [Talaromyces proteolyticus]KAH8701977.1 RNA polymerase III transcription factor IIIC subunit-domain-containing protein [Talaromyces proteolyticus]
MAGETNIPPRYAPWYEVPQRRIVAVEHPGIVKNVDRAIRTLQGEAGLAKPEDPMARPIESINRQTNNVLLKITVPKWTGRKRKRGSDEPFADSKPTPEEIERERQSCTFRRQSLRDNASKYSVEAVGAVERTHNYRSIPDFVFSTTASPFTQRFRESILSNKFEKMKQFDLSLHRPKKGETKNIDLIPPPAFSKTHIPFQYTYRQNPTVKMWHDTAGNISSINTQTPNKVLAHLVPYDIPEVPSKPREELAPVSSLDPDLRATIAAVEALFSERLAWTRRALRNHLKAPEHRSSLRYAIGYVGYTFRSGPWRDAIVKLGHDPRTDVEFRKYQTFVFRVQARQPDVARDGGGSAAKRHSGVRDTVESRDFSGLDISTIPTVTKDEMPDSHLWTGKAPLPLDGKIWMLCDIVDPIIKNIFYPANPAPDFLRKECDPLSDGWFGNGTLAKARTIIRQKINALTQQHREPGDSEYECILSFPDYVRDEGLEEFYLNPETATAKEMAMATEVRMTIKGSANWRHTVTMGKMGGAKSLKRTREEDEEEREAARRAMEEEEVSEEEEEEEEEERDVEKGDEEQDDDDDDDDDEQEENGNFDDDEDNESEGVDVERPGAGMGKRQQSRKGKGKQKRVRIRG